MEFYDVMISLWLIKNISGNCFQLFYNLLEMFHLIFYIVIAKNHTDRIKI